MQSWLDLCWGSAKKAWLLDLSTLFETTNYDLQPIIGGICFVLVSQVGFWWFSVGDDWLPLLLKMGAFWWQVYCIFGISQYLYGIVGANFQTWSKMLLICWWQPDLFLQWHPVCRHWGLDGAGDWNQAHTRQMCLFQGSQFQRGDRHSLVSSLSQLCRW